MNSKEWPDIQQTFDSRRETIAEILYTAIAPISFAPGSAGKVHQQLVELTSQVMELLYTEPLDCSRAQAAGASLARLHCIQAKALGRTLEVLAHQLVAGLSADQVLALQPRLASLLGRFTEGFLQQSRRTILQEQEQIRQALITEMAQSEQALRALLDAANDVAVLINTAGTILVINEIGARRRGKSVDELVGSCIYDFFPPHVAQGRKARVEQVIRSGKPVRIKGEYQGSFCDTNVYPVFDAQGEVARIAIFVRDVTERKRVEDTLQESEERYRAISELTSDFAYALRVEPDDTLVIEWKTDAFSCITGIPIQEVFTIDDWVNIIHPQDRLTSLRHVQTVLSGHSAIDEWRIIHREGNIRWLRLHSQPVWDETQSNVVRIIGAAKDITECQRLTESLFQTERLAAMGRLAATLAHEINNPLQALRSGLRVLMRNSYEREKQQRYLELIDNEVDRLSTVVANTLSLQHSSADQWELTDVDALLDETLSLVGKHLQQNQITVQHNPSQDLPPVEASAAQLKQVFLNIIFNALDAMASEGELAIETGWDSDLDEIWISFDDTGNGIPPDVIPHIFEPFYTTKHGSTGLGLTICYNIVEQHKGRIEVASQLSAGSTFTVFLPTSRARD